MGIVSALVGGAINAASNANQSRKNRSHQLNMQRIQNQFNHDEAILSAQRNSDEWSRQFNLTNAYNSPSAQMMRYRQAGLNPYLASVGDGNSGASASASGSTAAQASNVPYSDAYSSPGADFIQGVQATANSALSVFNSLEKQKTLKTDIASRIADNLLNSDLYDVKKEALESALKSQSARNNYDAAYYTLKLNKVDDVLAQDIAQMMARTDELITQIRLNETNEKLAYQEERKIRGSFNLWLDGLREDNHLKRSQWKSVEAATSQSWQYMNNTLKDSAQNRRESNSRIMLNGMQGALLGVQAALGRQQYGFNGLMNPYLINSQIWDNRLKEQRFGFNSRINPYLINSQIWDNKAKQQLFDYNSKLYPLNLTGKRIQNASDLERYYYNTISDFDNLSDNFFGGQLDFNLGFGSNGKKGHSSFGFSRHKVYRSR